MNSVNSVLENFIFLPNNIKIDVLLFGDSRLEESKNKFILESTLSYIKRTERFSGSLFD